MKKIILGMVFVFATVTFVNANSNVEEQVNREIVEIVDGSPGDCVRSSRNATIALADAYDWDIYGDEADFAMGVYMTIYRDCLNN